MLADAVLHLGRRERCSMRSTIATDREVDPTGEDDDALPDGDEHQRHRRCSRSTSTRTSPGRHRAGRGRARCRRAVRPPRIASASRSGMFCASALRQRTPVRLGTADDGTVVTPPPPGVRPRRAPRRRRPGRRAPRDPALAHDEDAVAELRDLLGLARVVQERLSLRRELDHELVDVVLRADVHAARDVVEQQDSGSASSQRPIRTFCWLPPESVPTAWTPAVSRPDLQPLDRVRDERLLALATDDARAADPAEDRERQVVAYATSAASGPRSSDPRAPARCRAGAGSRPQGFRSRARLAADLHLAAGRLRRAEQRQEQVALPLAGQPADAEDLAAPQRRTRRRASRSPRRSLHPSAPRRRSASAGRSGYSAVDRPPGHQRDRLALGQLLAASRRASPLRKIVIRSARSRPRPSGAR